MKVLVYPPTLELGGSQRNAIDLATVLAARGHEVAVVAARPGPLAEAVAAGGMRLHSLDLPGMRRPAPRAARALARLVRRERPDLVHAYEAPTTLEAFLAVRVALGVPVVSTILSMAVPARLPRSIPLVVGTRALQRQAERTGHRGVHLIEPPVDVRTDHPGADLDVDGFLRRHQLDDDQLRVVVVSRLERQLKLEGLQRLIAAAEILARDLPVRLVMVGDGSVRPLLERQAGEVNARLGRRAVVLTGALEDPRPAYAAAHVVAGMGGSILRGMAFAKPAIVVGEAGFSEPVTPATVRRFLEEGFYALGDGELGPERLCGQLRELLTDPGRWAPLGEFGCELVRERFAVGVAATTLEGIYERAVAAGSVAGGGRLAEAGRTLAWIGGLKAKQQLLRLRARRVPREGV